MLTSIDDDDDHTVWRLQLERFYAPGREGMLGSKFQVHGWKVRSASCGASYENDAIHDGTQDTCFGKHIAQCKGNAIGADNVGQDMSHEAQMGAKRRK